MKELQTVFEDLRQIEYLLCQAEINFSSRNFSFEEINILTEKVNSIQVTTESMIGVLKNARDNENT